LKPAIKREQTSLSKELQAIELSKRVNVERTLLSA
jgi:hypothetical protein